jgi:iron(III) transport system ATP-binding protein
VSRLAVSGLWKGYGPTRTVLRGVDLDVAAGGLSAVLGLSGCGKTTLLRVIAGLDRAERGTITLGPRTLEGPGTYVSPEHRGIGYVPQEGALFPHLTVQENVGFGISRAERRGRAVGELLEMVGIAPLARRLPHELSGGEQQRVALARALARRPDLLLLDEPFSSLDATLRNHVREEVHGLLSRQGVTTVLVTHDQEEALSLADTVAVMREGEIVQRGIPEELYNRPVDSALARFLGAANLIDATFRDGFAHTPLGVLAVRADPHSSMPAQGVVMLRPEQLEVRALDGGQDTTAAAGVHGHVEQCRYYGHDALLQIRPDDLNGGVGADLLVARVHGEAALAVGTAVSVLGHGPATWVR